MGLRGCRALGAGTQDARERRVGGRGLIWPFYRHQLHSALCCRPRPETLQFVRVVDLIRRDDAFDTRFGRVASTVP
jgi:hypothetical protein